LNLDERKCENGGVCSPKKKKRKEKELNDMTTTV
jgi:hypothetical protein